MENFPGRPEQTEQKLPIVIAATLLGPSVSGVVFSLIKYGVKGTGQNLRERMRWNSYYATLFFFAPAIVGTTLIILSALVSADEYRPAILTVNDEERVSFILIGLGYGAAAGMFEEIGWSFFVTPELLLKLSKLDAGLILGLVWGFWHFLVAIWGSGDAEGRFSMDQFLPWIPWNVLVLPLYRVFIVQVYGKTNSVIPTVIMHASLTASLPLILMPNITGVALASFYSLIAVALASILFCLSFVFGSEGTLVITKKKKVT
jgi:membrane protease YdiL (CAAX protease family)